MSINDIPVRVIGPGSQPVSEADKITYMDMPGDMTTYAAPVMPDPDEVMHMDGAREAMRWLRKALADYEPGAEPAFADLGALSDECRDLVNQVLGEGEVCITRDGDVRARIQESVLAGVWRTFLLDADGNVVCDLLEVADVPKLAGLGRESALPVDTSVNGDISELSNALPILVELESKRRKYTEAAHPYSINLSLLPLSEAELEFLDARLGRGPVDVLSRAYGKCQVISTNTPNVWGVRYYNSMGTLILNTLEVVDIPSVVAAAPEDLADSAERLAEILEPYWSEVA